MPLIYPTGHFASGRQAPALILNGTDEYLSRTPSVSSFPASTRAWSVWVYRTTAASNDPIMSSAQSVSDGRIYINSSNQIVYHERASPGLSTKCLVTSTTAALVANTWFHVFVVVNFSAASGERVRFWVNGTETLKTVSTAYDGTSSIGLTLAHQIGRDQVSGDCFGGKIARYHWMDTTTASVSDFGALDGGVWKAKPNPAPTYGNNGFFFDFSDANDLGNDAGSTHDHALNNIDSSNYTSDGPPILEA